MSGRPGLLRLPGLPLFEQGLSGQRCAYRTCFLVADDRHVIAGIESQPGKNRQHLGRLNSEQFG